MNPAEKDIFRLEKGGPLHFADFSLLQICDIQTARDSLCPLHVQFCDEISFVASGYCRQTANGSEYDMKAGDMLLLRQDDVHAYITDPLHPARIFNIGLSPREKNYIGLAEECLEWRTAPAPILLHGMKRAGEIFIRVFEELSANQFGWEQAVRLYTEELLLDISRAMRKISVQPYMPESGAAVNNRLLYAVIHYVDTHLGEMDALQGMPEALHYSYTHLSHLFKKAMGVSLAEYYRQKRFSRAADLLAREHDSVTEAARKLGYQTIHSFSRAFSKYYGICPSEYIRLGEKSGTL